MNFRDLNKLLGNMDIYLLDQLLKGRLEGRKRILDVGCGEGRNLIYFISEGFDVYGVDKKAASLLMLKYLAKQIRPDFDERKLIEADASRLPLPTAYFDYIISSAVLHFAESEEDFWVQVTELNRVLQPDGILFIRMTSDIGFPSVPQEIGNGRFIIPDGSTRFLLNRRHIDLLQKKFEWELLEPVKTTNVSDQRCMTTLVFRKK